MKPKLLIIYVVIVVAPLLALAVLGAALARNERAIMEVRFQELLAGRLEEVARQVDQFVEARERELMDLPAPQELAPGELRRLSLTSPIARQYFLLDPAGELVYPSPGEALTEDEVAFLKRTEDIWLRGEIPSGRPKSQQQGSRENARFVSGRGVAGESQHLDGWYVGYGNRDLRLIYWVRHSSGFILGSEVNEVRLKADIVALLPNHAGISNSTDVPRNDSQIALVDSHGQTIYKWGAYQPADGAVPVVRVPLRPPLAAWSLHYFAAPGSGIPAVGGGTVFYIGSGLAALFVALTVMAVYFYRENTRAFREAQQRVSFVNQVSHELKIPLTNIRMYAEMLEEDLDEADEPVRKRLGIIASESQRLSRLIGNVLTFNREKRGGFTLHPQAGIPDETVRAVLSHFESAFDGQGLTVRFVGGAGSEAEYDPDALEQIVSNLLSNVEKYVPNGGQVDLETWQSGDMLTVRVRDDGPGIAKDIAQRIFEPFYRPSNELTDGVSGVGLGLTIARQLAQLHGGNLTLDATESGASFTVHLHAPLVRGVDG